MPASGIQHWQHTDEVAAFAPVQTQTDHALQQNAESHFPTLTVVQQVMFITQLLQLLQPK